MNNQKTTGIPPRLDKKRVLIVGLARSGVALAHFLVQQSARVTVTDKKNERELESVLKTVPPSLRFKLGGHCLEEFLAHDLIVISPGVPTSLPEIQAARQRGIPVWSEVELAYRFLSGKVVGVTGSNGKTTTTSLIGSIFRRAGESVKVAGNIGTPLIGCLDKEGRESIYVVELSSFQLEATVQFRCNTALLLNITPDHLDRYQDFESYAMAKSRIFRNQNSRDIAILNALDPRTPELFQQIPARKYLFNSAERIKKGCFVSSGWINFVDGQDCWKLCSIDQLQLKGVHNLENCLASVSAALLMGVPPEVVTEVITRFQGIEHRLEYVKTVAGIDFYNDSKATNVDSAVKALGAFDRPVVAIMGGVEKGTDFNALRSPVRSRIKSLILLGSAAEKLAAALGDLVPTTQVRSMQEAVEHAFQIAIEGDVVLLSPACASFDMFKNFEDRGNVFKKVVGSLEENRLSGLEGRLG